MSERTQETPAFLTIWTEVEVRETLRGCVDVGCVSERVLTK